MEKDRRIKILSIVALLIAVAGLTIAFAAMSKTLTINGTATMDTAVWDIHFDSAKMQSKKGDAKEKEAPQITNGGIDLVLKVSLRKPKDEIVYNAVILNAGDIDAEIESIEYPTLTDDQKKVLEFEATYEDGTSITEKQELKSKDDITVKIVIRFKDISDESLLATTAYDIPLTFKINYVQKGVGNQNVPSVPEVDDGSKAVLAHNAEEFTETYDFLSAPIFNSPIERGEIESITFSKGVTERSGNTWDASASGDGSIIGYYEDSDDDLVYEVYIESESNIYAPVNSSYLFSGMWYLEEINFNNFKVNNVTNMHNMFLECMELTSLDLSSFNTSNVTTMRGMFNSCYSLTSLDLSSFNTGNVTDMSSMFWACELTSLYVSSFNTSSVTNMSYMFSGCSTLTSLDLSSFNTSNVNDMQNMFSECRGLTSLDLSNFNTSKVTNMSYMFYLCPSLRSINLSSFDTSNVTKTSFMFYNCKLLTEIKFNRANFGNIERYGYMFSIEEGQMNVTVYVKDEAAASFINTALQIDRATGTTVIEPLES